MKRKRREKWRGEQEESKRREDTKMKEKGGQKRSEEERKREKSLQRMKQQIWKREQQIFTRHVDIHFSSLTVTDEANTIYLKLFPNLPPPPQVKDHEVCLQKIMQANVLIVTSQ